jgi:phosphonatase-like hydrolase
MNDIQLVVFDIAGTTVHDDGSIALAFQDALSDFGIQVPVDAINPLMGYKKPEAIRIILENFNTGHADPMQVDAIHQLFQEKMIGYYTHTPSLSPMQDAEMVFLVLKQQGIRVGLDTGFSKAITDVIMDRLGWLKTGVVDFVVSSDEVEAGRPFPFMIQHLMRLAGVASPLAVAKVGDTEVDINEGHNAGCSLVVGVTTGAFTRQALLPYHPTHVIDQLSELLPILNIHATETSC